MLTPLLFEILKLGTLESSRLWHVRQPTLLRLRMERFYRDPYVFPGRCPYPRYVQTAISSCGVFSLEEVSNTNRTPVSMREELFDAIIETIEAGAKVINLIRGLSDFSLIPKTPKGVPICSESGVLLVVASGKQGGIGYSLPLADPWVIPVVPCDQQGKPAANLT